MTVEEVQGYKYLMTQNNTKENAPLHFHANAFNIYTVNSDIHLNIKRELTVAFSQQQCARKCPTMLHYSYTAHFVHF